MSADRRARRSSASRLPIIVERVIAFVIPPCLGKGMSGAAVHRLVLRELGRLSLGYVGYAAFMRRWNAAIDAASGRRSPGVTEHGVVRAVVHAPIDVTVVDREGHPIGRPLVTAHLLVDVAGRRPVVRSVRTEISFPCAAAAQGDGSTFGGGSRSGDRSGSASSTRDWSLAELEAAIAAVLAAARPSGRMDVLRDFDRFCDLNGRPRIDRRVFLAVARSAAVRRRLDGSGPAWGCTGW